MKKVLVISILVMAMLMFAGVVSAEQYHIIHVALGNYGDHWVQLSQGVQEMSQKLGVKLTVMNAEMNYDKQVTLLQNAIVMKPDAIFLDHGNSEALTPIVKEAVKAGIKVVVFDAVIPVEGVVCEMSQDDYMLGYMSLKKMAMDINGEGNIVVTSVVGSTPIERRKRMLPLILNHFPKIKVISEFGKTGKNVVSQTMDMMSAVLTQYPNEGDIDAVWAPWDQWALGCTKAIEAFGRDIPVYSVDVSPYDLKMMAKEGSVWKATAACDPSEIGRVGIRLCVLSLMGEEVPRYVMLPPALITQDDARNIPEGSYLTKEIVPQWGDSGIAWTKELREMAGE